MLNGVFAYISKVYDLETHLTDKFMNEHKIILFYTIKLFQIYLSKHE